MKRENRTLYNAAKAIVRRHVQACLRLGVEVEYLDRLWVEAIEIAELDERIPEDAVSVPWPECEPVRSYDAYVSPKGSL